MAPTERPADSAVATAIHRARAAYLRACALDVAVRKPGNVSVASPGHGMQAQQFVDSAQASATALFAVDSRGPSGVGERIEAAIDATWAAVGCNTNLGIVLLCAPIAVAVERCPRASSAAARCASIEAVLAGLDIDDARAAYRAIARAAPGGLGSVPREDVHQPPTQGLRSAMALAADRDTIAQLYRDGYAALFAVGVASLGELGPGEMPAGLAPPTARTECAVLRTHLAWLAHAPDSHIVRKHGDAVARSVSAAAARWRRDPRLHRRGTGLADDPEFIAWDASLKAAGINPGTSADLTVASMLLALIDRP